MKKPGFGLLLILTMLVLASCAQETPSVNFSAVLSGADEVPAVTTDGTGLVTATLQG